LRVHFYLEHNETTAAQWQHVLMLLQIRIDSGQCRQHRRTFDRTVVVELLPVTRLAAKDSAGANRKLQSLAPLKPPALTTDDKENIGSLICVYRQEHSACLGSTIGPNALRREPSTCASCRNFAVSAQHRSYWLEQARRHELLLNEPVLPTRTLKIARERLNEALAMVRSIDAVSENTSRGSRINRATPQASPRDLDGV
jgi:hypothetical protein